MNKIPYHFNAIVDGGVIVSLCPKCGAMYKLSDDKKTSEEAIKHYLDNHITIEPSSI